MLLGARSRRRNQTEIPENTVEHAWSHLLLVNDWVKHAEAKLGVTLAFVGVLTAALVALIIESGNPQTESWLMFILECASALMLLGSSLCTALGLLPRFAPQSDIDQANLLFFGDTANYFQRYGTRYREQLVDLLRDESSLVQEIIRQSHVNSNVAARKYKWANRAIFTGMLSMLLVVLVGVGAALGW